MKKKSKKFLFGPPLKGLKNFPSLSFMWAYFLYLSCSLVVIFIKIPKTWKKRTLGHVRVMRLWKQSRRFFRNLNFNWLSVEVCWSLTHQVSAQVSGHYQVEPHEEQEEDVNKVQFLVQSQGIVTKEGAYIAIDCDAEDESYKWDSEKTKPTQIMITGTHIKGLHSAFRCKVNNLLILEKKKKSEF